MSYVKDSRTNNVLLDHHHHQTVDTPHHHSHPREEIKLVSIIYLRYTLLIISLFNVARGVPDRQETPSQLTIQPGGQKNREYTYRKLLK